jgi:glutathione S-transferase
LAIACSGLTVELREVLLRDKPQAMLNISPKATVPVLQLSDGTVLDESLDIMRWLLIQNDSQSWLDEKYQADFNCLVSYNDDKFKYYLDRYKYADRYPEFSSVYYRQQAEVFLTELEHRLSQSAYLCAGHITLADAAIFPFIRQFSMVDQQWFDSSPYRALQTWLQQWLASPLFLTVMDKYQPWHPGDLQQIFSGQTIRS